MAWLPERLRLALQQLFETDRRFAGVGGDDPGAFLHVVEGGDRVVVVQDEAGADRIEVRNLGVRFEAAAEVIGDVAGKAALKWRQAGDMRLAVFGEQTVDDASGVRICLHAIEECSLARHLQRRRRDCRRGRNSGRDVPGA